jgi:hypothetical protein
MTISSPASQYRSAIVLTSWELRRCSPLGHHCSARLFGTHGSDSAQSISIDSVRQWKLGRCDLRLGKQSIYPTSVSSRSLPTLTETLM